MRVHADVDSSMGLFDGLTAVRSCHVCGEEFDEEDELKQHILTCTGASQEQFDDDDDDTIAHTAVVYVHDQGEINDVILAPDKVAQLLKGASAIAVYPPDEGQEMMSSSQAVFVVQKSQD